MYRLEVKYLLDRNNLIHILRATALTKSIFDTHVDCARMCALRFGIKQESLLLQVPKEPQTRRQIVVSQIALRFAERASRDKSLVVS